MKDLTERQDAIDTMCDACSDWCDEGVCRKVSAIQRLKSAQQELEHTMEEFMYGQDMGNPEDGSL